MAVEGDQSSDYSFDDLVEEYSEQEVFAAYGILKDKCWEEAFNHYKEFADRYRIGYWSDRQQKSMKQDLEEMHRWIDKALSGETEEDIEITNFDIHGYGMLLDEDIQGYDDFRKTIKSLEKIQI